MRLTARILLATLVVCVLFGFFHSRTGAQRQKPEGERACATPPAGMVGWWPGEGSGEDIQGQNDGTLENVVFSEAKVGTGFRFIGQRGVVVPDSPGLQAQRFTIDAWITLNAFTCQGGPGSCSASIVAKSGSDGLSGYELAAREDGSLSFVINGGSGSVSSIGSFSDGEFHHVAATYDGETVKLFVDGQMNNQGTFSGFVDYPGESPFIIGGRQFTTPTTAYPGIIDEPEFYSRALGDLEIQDLFNADSRGKCKPRCVAPPFSLRGWWTADDNPFDVWSSNHGVVENDPMAYADGKVGRAFDFNSSAHIRVPASRDLDVGGDESSFTIDAWIKPGLADGQPIVEWNDGNNIGVHLWVGFNSIERTEGISGLGFLFADIVDTQGNSHTISSNTGTIIPDVFQHVALVYNNNNNQALLYVNGVNVADETFETSPFTPQTSYDMYIGHRPFLVGNSKVKPEGIFNSFSGLIDEVELMSRDLNEFEMQDLYNAGFAGKCKPCLFPPSSMIGWWNADANPGDSVNGNDGTLVGGYRLGKAGQAFGFASANDRLVVSDSATLRPVGQITIDAWVNPASYPNSNSTVLSKGDDYVLTVATGKGSAIAQCSIGNFIFASGGEVPLDTWTHLACTYDGGSGTLLLYVNGEEVSSSEGTPEQSVPTSGADLIIGGIVDRLDANFDGSIDEIEVFNRALAADEIKSIVAAGGSGKCKFDFLEQVTARPEGKESIVTLGDATIFYNGLKGFNPTFYQTLEPYQVGPLPFGFNSPLEVVDLTSQNLFDSARVCFNLQASEFSGPFAQLRILHLESGELVNRTSSADSQSRTLCADVTSLSPFVIAQNTNAPTAAPGTISGRISLADGSPLAGAEIELAGAETRSTITDSNGSYAFATIDTDAFYTLTPKRANFSFSPSALSFSLLGSKTDALFTAVPDAVPTRNPVDTDMFFVRQQYLDFLGREPDAGGLVYWVNQLASCRNDDACARIRRIEISAAFFDSEEFQQTGSFIYRVYLAGLGREVNYSQFTSDRVLLVAGPDLDRSKLAFATALVGRPEFIARHAANTTAEAFVDDLLQTVRRGRVEPSIDRARLINLYNSGGSLASSRALVLGALGNDAAFQRATYNQAFVLIEYYGYLQRDPDRQGYEFWLDVLNNREQGNFRSMVCAFITSAEYQKRFGTVVTRSNSDCGQ